MTTNTNILSAHPSVQDLGIQYGGINLAKTSLHKMLINSKPLHEMSNSDFGAIVHKHRGGGKNARASEPKDSRVTVVKNSTGGYGVGGGSANANNGYGMLPSIGQSPASVAGGRPGTGTIGRSFSVTNTKTNGREAMLSPTGKDARNMPATTGAPKVVTQLPPRKNPSLVSSAFSYSDDGCSDCGSFSMYSCSCCHVKPPSSVASTRTSIPSSSVASDPMKRRKVGTTYFTPKEAGGKLSAAALLKKTMADGGSTIGRPNDDDCEDNFEQYENLTSVSQRCSNASVTSSQIASLKQELESERRTRLQTQLELQKIRERQQMLLDRLASKEHSNMTADDKYTIRRMLKEVNQQLNSMGVSTVGATGEPPRGSAVGVPVDASDSVMQ